MTKHVADRRAPTDGGRIAAFAEIARRMGEEGSHPASQMLARRPRKAESPERLAQFLRIARGEHRQARTSLS